MEQVSGKFKRSPCKSCTLQTCKEVSHTTTNFNSHSEAVFIWWQHCSWTSLASAWESRETSIPVGELYDARERTSITLSVLEPSQTPTPLCYQGVIFSHTPPSPLPWLRNTWIMSSIKQIFRKGLLLHNKSLWTECISRNQCYNHPQPKDFWATLLLDHNLWLTDCLFPCLSGEKCCD